MSAVSNAVEDSRTGSQMMIRGLNTSDGFLDVHSLPSLIAAMSCWSVSISIQLLVSGLTKEVLDLEINAFLM